MKPIITAQQRRLLAKGVPAAEAERYFGLRPGTIRQWINRDGKLRPSDYAKIGREWYVIPKAVEKIIKEFGIGE